MESSCNSLCSKPWRFVTKTGVIPSKISIRRGDQLTHSSSVIPCLIDLFTSRTTLHRIHWAHMISLTAFIYTDSPEELMDSINIVNTLSKSDCQILLKLNIHDKPVNTLRATVDLTTDVAIEIQPVSTLILEMSCNNSQIQTISYFNSSYS